MASCLKAFFCNPACDVRRGGLTLKLPDGDLVTIWFDYSMALQDGAAHKFVYCIKGDSGCRFCCLCLNAWNSVSEVLDEEGNPLMVCTMCKVSDMRLASDTDILQAVDRLAHRRATITNETVFERWQKASGLVHQPNGLLLDPALRSIDVLRPCSQYCHDPMHTMVANGVMNVVMWLVLAALSHHMDIWGSLYSYVALWHIPKHFKGNGLHEMFSRKRERSCKEAKKFKCIASELLGVYPIVAYFFQNIIQRGDCECKLELSAFLKCCDLMDLFMFIPLGLVSPKALREAVEGLLEACMDAGWEKRFIKKFHWLLHMAEHLSKWGKIPTCFSLERKHRLVKRFAKVILNTVDYAQAIYRETINHELAKLRQPDIFKSGIFLVGKHYPSQKTLRFLCDYFSTNITRDRCFVSNSAHLQPEGFAEKGDVALLKAAGDDIGPWGACQVWLHVEVEGHAPMSMVSLYNFVRYDENLYSATWDAKAAPVFVYTSDIICSTSYRKSNAGQVVTLIPLAHR
jgi:hypothetical protein